MKNWFKTTVSMVMGISLIAAPVMAFGQGTTYGAAGALADTDLTVGEILTYAIQDEYLAQSEYGAIMDKFSVQKPFSNIKKAEATHIRLLVPLFAVHGIEVPVDDAVEHIIVPETLAASYQAGVEAEIDNIAMYTKFLEEKLPEDIKAVVEKLKAASEKHLAAFEKNVARTTGTTVTATSGSQSAVRPRRGFSNRSW